MKVHNDSPVQNPFQAHPDTATNRGRGEEWRISGGVVLFDKIELWFIIVLWSYYGHKSLLKVRTIYRSSNVGGDVKGLST